MKLRSVFFLLSLIVLASACTPAEKVRVENVIGPYDCTWNCKAVDLTGQTGDVETTGDETIFVKKGADWEEGYIDIGDRTVFLLEDSSFTLSETDYFLSGEFTKDGQLVFTESTVDRANNVRNDCDYLGYLK